MKIDPMHIDLVLYALIAFCGAWATLLGTDDAAHFIAPGVLFFLKGIVASTGLTSTAIKTFRSESFSAYLKRRGDTEEIWKVKQAEADAARSRSQHLKSNP